MKLDKRIVDRNYKYDINFCPMDSLFCLDLQIADSLKLVEDFIDNGLEQELGTYYESANL